jgi:hypothetical protein
MFEKLIQQGHELAEQLGLRVAVLWERTLDPSTPVRSEKALLADLNGWEKSARDLIEKEFGVDSDQLREWQEYHAGVIARSKLKGTSDESNQEAVYGAIVLLHKFASAHLSKASNMASKIGMRILFMAANPTTTTPLDLEEELRSVELELRGVKYRDQIAFTARHAVRPDDLLRHVRSEQPTVIHFSGHGSTEGIILRSDSGKSTKVTGPNLRRFLKGRGVELLVLNACYTKSHAEHVAGAVRAIVGTTSAVGDEAARRFTVAFYRALGDGLSIREAFRDGGDAVALHGLTELSGKSFALSPSSSNPRSTCS